jgi:uncharacterized protein (DUF1015 family)
VPYDVVYESEVREYIERNPRSFLRVTRAEAEFPVGSKPSPAEVFARARQNLEWFIKEKLYGLDEDECFYIYQLATSENVQTGVVGCCCLDEYEQGIIKKHEKVRPDKVEDRTQHLLAVRAQTGLIFLTFRNTAKIKSLITEAVTAEPIYRFECPEGIIQSVWRITDTEKWVSAFSEVPSLYIADGHHRAESALNARNELRRRNPSSTVLADHDFVVAGIFPAEDLRILPYNRVVKDLHGLNEGEFFAKLREHFDVSETDDNVPHKHGELCMYMRRRWYKLRFRIPTDHEPDPIERLDVSILQDHLLGPILGIHDARTDKRIGFVGGARGTAELERLVDEGKMKVAFSMFPTTMDDLLAVSDVGEIMPPKSTWFEPKLKDGLLVHMIGNG